MKRNLRAIKRPAAETEFLNVDLDLFSQSDLQPLVTALGEKVFVLHVGREKGTYSAHLELPGISKDADSTISRFCTSIRGLPRVALNLWKGCKCRDFNIGVEVGLRPKSYEIALAAETVKAISDPTHGSY